MNCQELANLGLELDGAGSLSNRNAAREHMRTCAACAALYESTERLRADLHELGMATADATAPSRVEMRLRQEFRTRHTTVKTRDRVVIASWLLAAATHRIGRRVAVLLAAKKGADTWRMCRR